jgi:hypothetical protein
LSYYLSSEISFRYERRKAGVFISLEIEQISYNDYISAHLVFKRN